MNHDLAHCDGDKCPRRDICKRYIAYRNLKGDEEYPISFCTAVDCMIDDYKLYWEDKK